MDFMLLANAMVMPYLNGLFIANPSSTCLVQGTYLQDSVRSTGLRRGDQTYLAALIEIKPDIVQEVPDEVAELLQEFKDVFPPKLPKSCPHDELSIMLLNWSLVHDRLRRPLTAWPCGVAEFRKQLDGLLEPGWSSRPRHHLFDKLTKAKYYTKIDLRSGYWQVRVARGDEPKTTCVTRPFEVQVNASDWALGGVLVQDKHPVAFESRKLKDAELWYNTYEKEMMVVVHCLEAWRHYLLGTKFTVVTDNVANTYFKTQRKLSPKQARWQEFLGEFEFDWVHRPGKHNDVADALSRKLVEEYVAALTVVEYDFLDQIRESSKTDAGYLKLVEQVKSGLIRKY
ncbi:UNVERIFIED_CONTAM: RNA-directed DNA polymerase [Sesamum radiatum]|uniref:RNA-directed DNA polymerase n=1 Tax=Sesamum radiatum TaxID=300843 RepID=A0AAW2V3Q0_SESRA